VFHVKHFVVAELYVFWYKYNMKKRKQIKKKRTIGRLRASAGAEKIPAELAGDWPKYYKVIKKPVTLRLDADVLAWFKKQGRGYQTRINQALRKVVAAERKG
jgi:uncharacterized protein (DUF4415 family)